MAVRYLIVTIAVLAAAFHMYTAGVEPFTALVQRPVHLALMAVLGFLGVGVMTGVGKYWDDQKLWERALSVLMAAGMTWTCFHLALRHEALVQQIGPPTSLDLVAGVVCILTLLELTRRTTGWGLILIAMAALAYAVVGPYLPGILAHRGYSPARIVEHLYLSMDGIWGIPLGVSADFVYLFVLFGTILEVAGGGLLFIGLAARVAGRLRGGPAITASVASAFMGSLSGSAVANVVTTGSLTIPMMRRAGFKPHFAAGIEAAASTAGQLMPPVMGAGAFILATWTNIPYLTVAVTAIVPAVLYYVALVMAIQFRAAKMKLDARGAVADSGPVLPRIHLLIPIVVIVIFLAIGRSPMRAAFWGVVAGVLATFLTAKTRMTLPQGRDALIRGASSTVQVAAACATAGLVVGVASLTGIGLRMSDLIVTLSMGYLPLALLLTAMGSIVLGMGLPTTAAYVVLAALAAPALTDLGVPLLTAHLFVFYFGCMSNVTPPVALAAFAASGVAGAEPMRTAVTAMLLASAGFVVPFMFVYGPPLLLDGTVFEITLAVVTGIIGVTALAGGAMGYFSRELPWWERILLSTSAFIMLYPGFPSDVLGLVVILFVFYRKPREPGMPAAAGAPGEESPVMGASR